MDATSNPASLKRILVPIDFTSACHQALREADRLALPTGAQVVLLNILPVAVDFDDHTGLSTPASWGAEQKTEDTHDRLIELARRQLSRQVNFATAVLVQPDTVRSIAGYAGIIGADLIVIGIRNRKAVGHELDERSPREIIETASCPVMLVRGQDDQVRVAA